MRRDCWGGKTACARMMSARSRRMNRMVAHNDSSDGAALGEELSLISKAHSEIILCGPQVPPGLLCDHPPSAYQALVCGARAALSLQ
jgi:hypothetical protein